jgi:hypothetical protein
VQVQRLKDANLYEDYKYMGSPVQNFPFPAEMWRLNKYVPGTGWVKTYENMTWGVGYAAQTYASNVRLTFAGTVNVGPFDWVDLPAGWNLIANPYPSAIRWPLVGGDTTQVPNTSKWVLNNVSYTIGITDNSVSGYPSYFRHLNADGTWGSGTVDNQVIAMGQAFWVYVGAGGGDITVKERAKVIDTYATGQFYRERRADEPDQLIVAINNGKMQDHSILKLDSKATEGYEFNMDLPKLWNDQMNVFLLSDTKQEMLINALPALRDGHDIPVGVKVSAAGDYEFQFSPTSTFRYSTTLYLVDKQEGIAVPVSGGDRYKFSINAVNRPVTDRFYLTLNPDHQMTDVHVSVFPNPAQDKLTIEAYGSPYTEVTLLDMNGNLLKSAAFKGMGTVDIAPYPNGMYVLKVKTDKGLMTRKVVKR